MSTLRSLGTETDGPGHHVLKLSSRGGSLLRAATAWKANCCNPWGRKPHFVSPHARAAADHSARGPGRDRTNPSSALQSLAMGASPLVSRLPATTNLFLLALNLVGISLIPEREREREIGCWQMEAFETCSLRWGHEAGWAEGND